MDFDQTLEYLLSLGNEVAAMKLGLESISKLLEAIGNPQKNYLKVQVAGTNGKGSVCAFLNSICVTAGIRVGMFTSPHLTSITERVQIDGVPLSEDDFARYATKVRAVAEGLVANGTIESIPTFFEHVTAIALLAFSKAEVELAILETGLGGRLDATTAADAEVVAFTRIDLDHQEYLGETIEEIAAEKAAIIRDGFVDVVIGAQTREALDVILDRCRKYNITPANEIFGPWKVIQVDADHVRVETTLYVFPDVVLGLKGTHQIENSETAINIFGAFIYCHGKDFDESDVRAGLESTRHPGRLEFQGRYLFDGAHNVGGAKALRAYLDEFIDKPITMIFGAMRDKDVNEIAEILFPAARTLVITEPNNERSASADELEAIANRHAVGTDIIKTTSVAEALAKAKAASKKRGLILITGSLYLVGEARRLLAEMQDLKFENSNLR